jgi:hypothetical protein
MWVCNRLSPSPSLFLSQPSPFPPYPVLFGLSLPPSGLSPLLSLTLTLSPTPSPAPAVLASCYEPAPSRPFTDIEHHHGADKVTRETVAHCIIEHLYDAIIEYSETGSSPGVAIAHIFNINPDSFYHPPSTSNICSETDMVGVMRSFARC